MALPLRPSHFTWQLDEYYGKDNNAIPLSLRQVQNGEFEVYLDRVAFVGATCTPVAAVEGDPVTTTPDGTTVTTTTDTSAVVGATVLDFKTSIWPETFTIPIVNGVNDCNFYLGRAFVPNLMTVALTDHKTGIAYDYEVIETTVTVVTVTPADPGAEPPTEETTETVITKTYSTGVEIIFTFRFKKIAP